jgi:hypothetical protein
VNRETITLTDPNTENGQAEEEDGYEEYAVLPQVKNPPPWYKALYQHWKVKKPKKNQTTTTTTTTTAPPPS